MSGASASLDSQRGTGPDILSVDPQITFFKKVFKRHTNFGIESKVQSVTSGLNTNGNISFGSTVSINVSKSGDLVGAMHLEFTLPPVIANNTNNGILSIDNKINVNDFDYGRYVNAVGFAVIDQVLLKIKDRTIDKHTGLWFDIWNELTDPNKKEWPLVGKFRDVTENDRDLEQTITTSRRYYVPLKFFFNRNPGLALPIFLLDDNALKIEIKFANFYSLVVAKTDGGGNITQQNEPEIRNFKLLVDYISLEHSEKAKIEKNLPSEYLIETLTIEDDITANNKELIINYPIKEFIWVFRHNSRKTKISTVDNIPEYNLPGRFIGSGTSGTSGNDIFNYSYHDNTSTDYQTFDTFKTLKILISNRDRFEETDSTYFRTIQAYNTHSNIPGGGDEVSRNKKAFIYVYSFAIYPEEYQPSGSFNPSKKDDKIKFNFTSNNNDFFENYTLTIFAVKYEYMKIEGNKSLTVGNVPKLSINEQIYKETDSSGSTEDQDSSAAYNTSTDTSTDTSTEQKASTNKREMKEHSHPQLHSHTKKKKWKGLEGDIINKFK